MPLTLSHTARRAAIELFSLLLHHHSLIQKRPTSSSHLPFSYFISLLWTLWHGEYTQAMHRQDLHLTTAWRMGETLGIGIIHGSERNRTLLARSDSISDRFGYLGTSMRVLVLLTEARLGRTGSARRISFSVFIGQFFSHLHSYLDLVSVLLEEFGSLSSPSFGNDNSLNRLSPPFPLLPSSLVLGRPK